MTAQAKILQADIDRAAKAVAKAGINSARIILDFDKKRIEIIIGSAANESGPSKWSDDDI